MRPPAPSPRHSGNAHGGRQPVRHGTAATRTAGGNPSAAAPPCSDAPDRACVADRPSRRTRHPRRHSRPRPRVSARRRAPPPSPVASVRVGPSPPRPPHPAPCTNSGTTARLRPDRHLHRHPRRHETAATRTAGSNPPAAAPLCSDSSDRACVIDRPSRRTRHPRHRSRPRPRPYRLAAERHANCQWRPVESVRLPLDPPICPPPPSVALHQWRRPYTPPPPPPPPSPPSWSPHSGNVAQPGPDAVGATHILSAHPGRAIGDRRLICHNRRGCRKWPGRCRLPPPRLPSTKLPPKTAGTVSRRLRGCCTPGAAAAAVAVVAAVPAVATA